MTKQSELATALALALSEYRVPARDRDFAQSLSNGYGKYGSWTARQLPHVERIVSDAGVKAAKAAHVQPEATAVGDLSGILDLFARARKHLKFPAIVLGVPAIGNDFAIRINVAGAKAREPGSLTVVDHLRDEAEGRREYLGNVSLSGRYTPSRSAMGLEYEHIIARLREFAADPAHVASEHGRLTGRCCFCNLPLKDERSTSVGYGKTCAAKWGLAWGARPAPVEKPSLPFPDDAADERAMMCMEAEGDRLSTIRDERNKHAHRARLESSYRYPEEARQADEESARHVAMYGGDGW